MSDLTDELKRLHGLLLRARLLAYEQEDFKQIGSLLDDSEYLVSLLTHGDVDGFNRYADGITPRYGGSTESHSGENVMPGAVPRAKIA